MVDVRIMTRTSARGAAFVVLLVTAALFIVACGSKTSNSTSSSSPAQSKGSPSPTVTGVTETQIKTNWEAFFAGTTPAAEKIKLLQNGQAFASIINAQAASPIAKGTQAQVSAVTVTSKTTATVTYSILLGGQVALANQTGQAVQEGGTWKVGDQSFQALLGLEKASSPAPSSTP